MPSPFPGMDPFIECGPWSDFHATFISEMKRVLNRDLPDGYAARVEQRVFVDDEPPASESREVAPDTVVFESDVSRSGSPSPGMPARETSATVAHIVEWPTPVQYRESWLEIRDLEHSRIVSMIELLSPINKRRRTSGRRLYLRKRHQVLESRSHFIEIDLLRGGGTVWPVAVRPPGDYYVAVSRAERRPKVELYSWALRDALPSVSIPLKAGTPDVILSLRDAFNSVYEDSRYGRSLYSISLSPKLSAEDQLWVHPLLQQPADSHPD